MLRCSSCATTVTAHREVAQESNMDFAQLGLKTVRNMWLTMPTADQRFPYTTVAPCVTHGQDPAGPKIQPNCTRSI